MNSDWKKEYEDKKRNIEEAVQIVRDGDTVFIGSASSVATALCDGLADRIADLNDITITGSLASKSTRLFSDDVKNRVRFRSYYLGPAGRSLLGSENFDFTSFHLSQLDLFCREIEPASVAFFEVSLPDENGYMSYGGTGVTVDSYVKNTADRIVLQVNRNAPYLRGEDTLIHISEADYIVEADSDIAAVPPIPITEDIRAISNYIVEQIPDGACIQLGIGGLAGAIGEGLKDHNDLGVHTEMLADSIMHLMKQGVVTNKKKTFLPGVSAAGFAYGSRDLYAFLNHNPDVWFLPFPKVNDPVNIAKNDNMISVNSAITIDLMGQVCSDNIAGRQYSGIGGQLDYVRGAQMSKNGKSFIAINSMAENRKGERYSKIVSRLPAGAAVSTPRADVQYVVTEYGCVNLKLLSMKDRIRAMISLAHPDFRDQLKEEAKAFHLL